MGWYQTPYLLGLDHPLELALLLQRVAAVARAAAAAEDERDQDADDGGKRDDGHVADGGGVLVVELEEAGVVAVGLVEQAGGLAELVGLLVVNRGGMDGCWCWCVLSMVRRDFHQCSRCSLYQWRVIELVLTLFKGGEQMPQPAAKQALQLAE